MIRCWLKKDEIYKYVVLNTREHWMSYMYLQAQFLPPPQAHEILDAVKASLTDSIMANRFFDDETRTKAKTKVIGLGNLGMWHRDAPISRSICIYGNIIVCRCCWWKRGILFVKMIFDWLHKISERKYCHSNGEICVNIRVQANFAQYGIFFRPV